jgi:hypothetical protein
VASSFNQSSIASSTSSSVAPVKVSRVPVLGISIVTRNPKRVAPTSTASSIPR